MHGTPVYLMCSTISGTPSGGLTLSQFSFPLIKMKSEAKKIINDCVFHDGCDDDFIVVQGYTIESIQRKMVAMKTVIIILYVSFLSSVYLLMTTRCRANWIP